jgi:ferredoxin
MQGLMQPYMDYHSGFCNFDCTLCSEICPAGAILPVDPEVKKLEQIGIAKFIEGNCVVYTDNTDCGACSEHCPTKAVDMVPYKDGLTIPKVDETICIGCGACEYACPTRPYRAIYVEGNLVHKQAEKPVHEEIKIEDKGEDFPF